MNFQPRSQLSIAQRQLPFDCIALLLQGGGALGAYQAGVYEALAEANIHPDWVAGISIGAINAAIIITSALKATPRAVQGDPTTIREVVIGETSRHIISTTITTFGGFLPLILTVGTFWPPFATGIAGGVLLSAVLSFYFVPAAFLVITRRRPVVDSTPESVDVAFSPVEALS